MNFPPFSAHSPPSYASVTIPALGHEYSVFASSQLMSSTVPTEIFHLCFLHLDFYLISYFISTSPTIIFFFTISNNLF